MFYGCVFISRECITIRVHPYWRAFLDASYAIMRYIFTNISEFLDALYAIKLWWYIHTCAGPALATCETSHVLLAGVPGGFPGVLPFRPTYRLARLDMSEIIMKGTLS